MNIYSLPALISFTLNFSLAFIVLMDAPRARLNRWFSAFIFSFALWNISEIIILNSHSEMNAFFWAQVLYRIIFLAPAFFVIIAYHYPRTFQSWASKPLFYILVFSIPVLALLLSFPNFKIELVHLYPNSPIYYYHFTFTRDISFVILLSILVFYFLWGNLVLFRKREKLRTIRLKRQTTFFLVGINLVFLIFIGTQILHLIFQKVLSYYFLSSVITFVIDAFFFVAVVQFRIFRPRKLLSAGLSYTLLSSFALAVYFIIVKSLAESLTTYFHINSYTVSGLLIFLLILLIKPFEKKLNHLFDTRINRNIHQYRKNSLKLFRDLQKYMEPEQFFQYVEKFLKEYFHVSHVWSFYLPEEDATHFVQAGAEKLPISVPVHCYLTRELSHRKKPIDFYELEHEAISEPILASLKSVHTRLILPLLFENKLLGFLVLSRKRLNLQYNEDELEIFEIFSRNIASALQRDFIIRQMREHYRERFRLEKLAALGQLTAGIAHEIRNPLNTISASAETLLQPGIAPEDQQELKQYIIDEVNRLNNILSDFLNLSRIKPPELKPVALSEIEQFVEMNLRSMAEDGIAIHCQVIPADAVVPIDPSLLKQILINLGSNAIAAIQSRAEQEEQFTLAAGKISCQMEVREKRLLVHIVDNGVGIPEEIKEKIFEPFFTTRETGTGLGLSIVQQMVEALGGKISAESEVGHTEFTLVFPLKEAQKEVHHE